MIYISCTIGIIIGFLGLVWLDKIQRKLEQKEEVPPEKVNKILLKMD